MTCTFICTDLLLTFNQAQHIEVSPIQVSLTFPWVLIKEEHLYNAKNVGEEVCDRKAVHLKQVHLVGSPEVVSDLKDPIHRSK